MAHHTGDGDRGGSRAKYIVRPVIPALPLRLMRESSSKKATVSSPARNEVGQSISQATPASGWSTPENALKIQFGGMEGDSERLADTPASLNQTCSPLNAAPSPLPSNTSNNDTLSQAASSRPSSAPPPLKIPSDHHIHTPQQTPRTAVVELPADACISRSSSLKISFLYQEDLDSASPTSTAQSRSPINPSPRTMSPLKNPNLLHSTANQSSAVRDAEDVDLRTLDVIKDYHPSDVPVIRPGLSLPSHMVSLSMHVLLLFDLKIQCDQQIIVQVPSNPPNNYCFDAHKMIISRAPELAMLMHLHRANSTETDRFTMFWPIGYFDETAFAMCLRYLYSDAVLTVDQLETCTHLGANQNINEWRSSQFMFTIVYWLGGLILQAEAVAVQAEAIVSGLMNFDIIGVALNAATDLYDHGIFGVDRSPADTTAKHNYRKFVPYPAVDPVANEVTPNGDAPTPDASPLTRRRKMFEAASKLGTRLNELIFGFIASNITFKDFQLDTTLNQTLIKPLLPMTCELSDRYRPQVPVQSIQFGQLPTRQSSNPARPLSTRNRYTSYIMLNLPFGNLKEAIAIMRRVAKERKVEDVWVKEFTEKVIAEREIRREIVNDSSSVSDEERIARMDVWRVTGYEESVVEGADMGEWDIMVGCSVKWAQHD